jgi:hypothetical protein
VLVCTDVASLDAVITVMSTCALPEGGYAEIEVELVTWKHPPAEPEHGNAAATFTSVVLNFRSVAVKPAPLKSVPVMVISGDPPAAGPAFGLTAVIVGTGCTYRY